MDVRELLNLKKELRFDENGKFRILLMTDLHAGHGFSPQLTEGVEALVEHCKPDLVLLNGDTSGCHRRVHCENESDLREVLGAVTAPMERNSIPWAHVFGNHDDNYGFKKEDQETVYESYPCCVSKRGEVSGVANYVLPVLSHDGTKIAFNVFMLDSHDNLKVMSREQNRPGVLDAVLPVHFAAGRDYAMPYFDQVCNYYEQSKALEEYNGAPIPAMMAMHIPIPEVHLAYMNREECNFKGNAREDIGCGELNSGLFSACIQRGDVRLMCFGHDHQCDFDADYCGIHFAYGGGMAYNCYCDDDMRGGRVIELDENKPGEFMTYNVRLRDLLGSAADNIMGEHWKD